MNVLLDLPVGLKETLWSHLLKNETEQVAFVFAAVADAGDTTVFTAKDHYLATPDDRECLDHFIVLGCRHLDYLCRQFSSTILPSAHISRSTMN